jgi:DNA replication protein DnaC
MVAMMMEVVAMMNENTVMKLRRLRLHGMADEVGRQSDDSDSRAMSFSERFALIVDCEYTKKENSRLSRLIRNAGFSEPGACVEGIDHSAARKLDNGLVQRLASCEFIVSGHNVQILGATGVGKTYISTALGMAACRKSIPTKYSRLPEILVDLAVARENGMYAVAIKQYRKPKLLIIDDWLMFKANDSEAHMIYDLIEAR